jgi:hypothetical protein
MSSFVLRDRIAYEAARLLYQRRVGDVRQARRKATRRIARRWVDNDQLPSDEEIQQSFEAFHRMVTPPAEDECVDRFELFREVLRPLEQIVPGRTHHPEGDLLYHSLQVFTLARDELSYDEEFLTAALLHDAGKGIDPYDHEQAILDVLGDVLTDREAWLILHHTEGLHALDGTLGHRARKRLEESPDFEELMRLARCDRDGRALGRQTPDLEDALEYLQGLAEEFDGEGEEPAEEP